MTLQYLVLILSQDPHGFCAKLQCHGERRIGRILNRLVYGNANNATRGSVRKEPKFVEYLFTSGGRNIYCELRFCSVLVSEGIILDYVGSDSTILLTPYSDKPAINIAI
jgi:hypothetical protein